MNKNCMQGDTRTALHNFPKREKNMNTAAQYFLGFLAWSMLLLPAAQAASQAPKAVSSSREATVVELQGAIQGYQYSDYIFHGKAGQELTTWNSGKQTDTVLQGPMEKILMDGEPLTLPQTGAYTLRVLLPRAFARKNVNNTYTLKVALVTPSGKKSHPLPAKIGTHTAKDSLDWAGYYYGIIPCGSCPGIATWIRIEKQSQSTRYTLIQDYLEEDDGVFHSDGNASWNKEGTILHLKNADEQKHLFVAKNTLFFIGAEQKKPKKDSLYIVKKMHVFTGRGERFFVDPEKVTVCNSAKNGTVIRIQDGIINLAVPTKKGQHSLRADFEISCATKEYTMSTVSYYANTFATGKATTMLKGNEKQRLEFFDQQDVITQAATELGK